MESQTPKPKVKYHDYPAGEQRRSILDAHCDKKEEKIVFRPLSNDELSQLDKELAEHAVALKNHEDVLDLAKAKYKQDTVQLKENYKQLVQKIRMRGEELNTIVHDFFNHTEMTVEYYDSEGIFVGSRPMLPSEKNQFLSNNHSPLIVPIDHKTGTDN